MSKITLYIVDLDLLHPEGVKVESQTFDLTDEADVEELTKVLYSDQELNESTLETVARQWLSALWEARDEESPIVFLNETQMKAITNFTNAWIR